MMNVMEREHSIGQMVIILKVQISNLFHSSKGNWTNHYRQGKGKLCLATGETIEQEWNEKATNYEADIPRYPSKE